jgi:DNA polymerase-3 subunit gamma/tau
MTQALYNKLRPHRWDQVVGQEHVIRTLRNAVTAERVAHAFLLAGPRGTGKTTTARLLAKAVNCLSPNLADRPCDSCEHCQAVNGGRFLDLIEIDAASNTSVEDVRSLRDKINYSPNQGRYKVYIVDEVHMLSTAAFNALLKTLEEPPSHAIFILATTEVHKIPATVLSRCQRHEFRRIPVNNMIVHLNEMVEREGFQADPEALALVARQATGSLRDAISLLDQLASTGEKITLDLAHTVLGTATSQSVRDVVEALLSRDAKAGLEVIHRALDSGSDPRHFARQIVDYLRSLLLVRSGNASQVDAPPDLRALMARQAQALSGGDLLRILRAFNYAAVDARLAWQPALPLEMAFVDALEGPPEAGAGVAQPVEGQAAWGRTSSEEKPASQEKAAPREARPARQAPAPASPAEAAAVEMPAPPPEEAAPPAPDSGLTLDKVGKNWRQVLTLVRQQNPQTQGLLNSCKPLGLKGNVLYLGFNSDFAKAKMEKVEHLELTQQILSQVFGLEVLVRCLVAGNRQGPPPDVDSDGMVATALRDLGGEIVDIQ